MNPAILRFIGIAKAQIGVTESGGNNKGVEKYQRATWLKPGAWPWCAAFVAWCLMEFYSNLTGALAETAEDFRCKDSRAFGWIKWANAKGILVLDEKSLAKAGDLVVYDFSHIGIVVKDQLKLTDKIETVEGNVEPNTTQRDGSADGVHDMKRNTKTVKAYIRIFV